MPVIGSILASTIGKIIKPPRLMHTPDWIRESGDGVEILHPPEWNGPSYALGGLTPGLPQSPYGGEKVIQQMSYNFRELEGMTGWLKNAVTKNLTGSEMFFTQRPYLDTAGRMDSARDSFWDLELGGGFFTTEAIRRFLPRRLSEETTYNPILNRRSCSAPDCYLLPVS